jgi:glycosyltransferase involved in cell wall biosynthesis
MIDVIIPLYNNGKTIDAALASVVRQSLFSDSRVIIADDGSFDDSIVRVHKWAARYENIELHRNERNLGVTGNYARLLKLCRGDFVAPLEGDDVWLSGERLRILRRYLSETGLSVCFNKFLLHLGDNYSEGVPSLGRRYRLLSAYELIETNHPASFSNCFYRRIPFEGVLTEVEKAKSYDWLLNIVLAARTGGLGFVPEVLSAYRVSPNGTWSSLGARAQTAMIIRTLRQLKQFVPWKYWPNIDGKISAYRDNK